MYYGTGLPCGQPFPGNFDAILRKIYSVADDEYRGNPSGRFLYLGSIWGSVKLLIHGIGPGFSLRKLKIDQDQDSREGGQEYKYDVFGGSRCVGEDIETEISYSMEQSSRHNAPPVPVIAPGCEDRGSDHKGDEDQEIITKSHLHLVCPYHPEERKMPECVDHADE